MRKNRKIYAFLAVFAVFLAVFPWIGAEKLGFRQVFGFVVGDWTADGMIFFQIRLPRVLLGLLAGGALAMAGAALQVIFRNPLAEPWTLGIAGGASLGAFLARVCPFLWFALGPLNTAQAMALLGAAGALGLVLALARRSATGAQTLLLAGVTLGVVCGGAIMVISGFISPWKLAEFHRWLLGGLDAADWASVGALAALAVPGVALLLAQARNLNPLGLGEDMAAGQGVDVARVRRWTAIGAGLASAGVAAVAGPIGFVGLLAPHAVRKIVGPDARLVLPCSFLFGGALLAACDALGRWAAAPLEVPVGALTAVLGGPLFLALLARRR
ncbi:MAG: iron ABC transporter permease [Spartobacteria bacterium]|nr:iron ABC transporter permease [Spartobacteria bacterium]